MEGSVWQCSKRNFIIVSFYLHAGLRLSESEAEEPH